MERIDRLEGQQRECNGTEIDRQPPGERDVEEGIWDWGECHGDGSERARGGGVKKDSATETFRDNATRRTSLVRTRTPFHPSSISNTRANSRNGSENRRFSLRVLVTEGEPINEEDGERRSVKPKVDVKRQREHDGERCRLAVLSGHLRRRHEGWRKQNHRPIQGCYHNSERCCDQREHSPSGRQH